jgi:hypothetical protein
MGSTLKLEITSPQATGVGATYRYSGRMMGLAIDFSEAVTVYEPGHRKVWRTIGTPQLLIIAAYEMQVLVAPRSSNSTDLTIGIDYSLPTTPFWHLAGRLVANAYSRWCLTSMVEGAERDLEAGAAA